MTFLLNNDLNPSVCCCVRPLGLGSAQMLEIVQCCQLPVSRSVWRQCAGATFASKTVGLHCGAALKCIALLAADDGAIATNTYCVTL